MASSLESLSCDPKRTSAYSEDIRWRIIWQREVLGLKMEKVAQNLNLHPSMVCRVIKLFEETDTVSKRPYPKGGWSYELLQFTERFQDNSLLFSEFRVG